MTESNLYNRHSGVRSIAHPNQPYRQGDVVYNGLLISNLLLALVWFSLSNVENAKDKNFKTMQLIILLIVTTPELLMRHFGPFLMTFFKCVTFS